MTRWIGLCAVATVLLSSLVANAATPSAGGSQTPQTKSQATKSVAAKAPNTKAKAAAKGKAPKLEVHRVWAGQTLGMIAKRYNVGIEALCYANGISRRDPIQPGQKLYVPLRSDKDGSEARRLVLGEPEAEPIAQAAVETAPAARKPSATDKVATSKTARNDAPTKGAANGFPKVAPARAALPAPGTVAKGKKGPSWAQYTKPAPKKGYVVLNATGRNWKGYALVKGNRLSSSAQSGFNHALYSWRTGAQSTISPALIRILTKVSDTFGGRPLRVVSGYREHSHFKESRHKLGHACDFSVVGVPNNVLRDYLLTLDGVGVGYYPNSSFVHLDVRRIKTTWIDFSGPGERPRRTRQPVGKPPTAIPPYPTLPDLEDAPVASSPWPRVEPAHSPLFASTFDGDNTDVAPKLNTAPSAAAPAVRVQKAPATAAAPVASAKAQPVTATSVSAAASGSTSGSASSGVAGPAASGSSERATAGANSTPPRVGAASSGQ